MAKPADKSTALWVLKRLRRAGFEALLAGGCVRDMLLGARSVDYDIATIATPQQVKKLFRHVLLVGAKFGVAMVIHKGRKVEVTTFRSDLSYSDGRRPDGVRFTSPREDAKRRDFTINGMFYDPLAKKVIDYVGGRRDLKRGVVRTIGKADERFAEDYLRMIRAVRFAMRLGFRIAPATAAAIRKHAPKIASISGERIFEELSRMLSRASAGRAMEMLNKLHLARSILPELFASASLWEAAMYRLEAVAGRRDSVLALGGCLLELPAEKVRRIVRRWGASNELRDALCWMARHHQDWRAAAEIPLCQFKRLMANEHFDRLRRLWSAQERRLTACQQCTRRIARRAAGINPRKVAPPPLVNGRDLKKLGLPQGRKLGRVLRSVYDAQLNEEITTRREALAKSLELKEL